MSKKVYVLMNEDINEVICASEDRDLIREIMCDCFMEDLMYDWDWHLCVSRYTPEDLPEIAQMSWENTLEWYDEFIHIKTIEVI